MALSAAHAAATAANRSLTSTSVSHHWLLKPGVAIASWYGGHWVALLKPPHPGGNPDLADDILTAVTGTAVATLELPD